MAAEIRKAKGVEPKLVRGSGGVFEVTVDGQLVFSKKAAGRFPHVDEVLQKLPS